MPKIIGKIVNYFKTNGVKSLKTVGSNLIKGLWNGINNVKDWLWGKISGFFGGVVKKIKDFFGIKSPSRLMRDEIGKMLPQGLAIGIEADADKAIKAIDDMNNKIERQMKNAVYTEMGNINANATVKANNSMLNVTKLDLSVKGDVQLDGRKTGRLLADPVSRTIRQGGVYA